MHFLYLDFIHIYIDYIIIGKELCILYDKDKQLTSNNYIY